MVFPMLATASMGLIFFRDRRIAHSRLLASFSPSVNFSVSNVAKILKTLCNCFKVQLKNGTSMKIHEYHAQAILAR